MMLSELNLLLDYVSIPSSASEAYIQAIEEDNCLGKRSGRTRTLTRRHLSKLYSLDPDTTLNIRPFMSVADVKKKGAGVLREKPKIDWKKDRGKDVESAPWYYIFKGDRINDHHLTLPEKRAARKAAKRETIP